MSKSRSEPEVRVAEAGNGVPEREVVAVRTAGPHDHITSVKLQDGSEETAGEVIGSILVHEAHYVMRLPEGKHLLHARQCPDCAEVVVWA